MVISFVLLLSSSPSVIPIPVFLLGSVKDGVRFLFFYGIINSSFWQQ